MLDRSCYDRSMTTKKKKPTDINALAFQIASEATQESGQPPTDPKLEKNPAAVALGRLGGLKGGKARAEKLSSQERKEIARKAALARWVNKSP